ncbi:FMN-binding negative transcriptional regulator [Amphibiibacter pelophylacis]|uniref:FMN-binding negative transcriptional regulator n=1 Tax=Amphibiibacter pelophylacis TaxID=1799477 RepID=A0ACC6P4X1_9BURK
MYIPAHFAVDDPAALHDLIRQHPLGDLVTHGAQGLDANPLPFELDAQAGPHGTLRAHVARANPLAQQVRDGDAVLVIFRAEQGYISPGWYPSKAETHRLVPTWNYRVAHAHGRIRLRDDGRFLRGLLARLTRTHEAGQPQPWKMGDAPPGHIDTLLQSIVGLEIELTQLVGKFKLSQNREVRDRLGAADALDATGDSQSAALAGAMRGAGQG